MEQVSRHIPLDRTQFHARLREWLLGCNEQRIGSANYGRTAWIHVRDGGNLFALNADTGRDAVNQYLEVVKLHGNDLRWDITETKRGNMTAVSYGPSLCRIESFYFYLIPS